MGTCCFPSGVRISLIPSSSLSTWSINGCNQSIQKHLSEALYYIGFRKPFWKVCFQIISIMVYRIGAFGQGYHGDTVWFWRVPLYIGFFKEQNVPCSTEFFEMKIPSTRLFQVRGRRCVRYLLLISEGTVAVQILHQHSPCRLVCIPDKSQSDQETPECILLVVH